MKKTLFLLVIVGTFLSCKCKTTALENEQKHTVKILEDCPTKAKCTQDIFKDSGLVLSKDDTGKPFYSIVPQLGSTVYQYQMSENKDEQYMDGGYREEIIFEVPTDLKDGIYLVVQTGSSGKAKDFTNVQPFLVIIPQFENGIQNRVVNAKPKTEIQRKEKPEIPPQTPPDLSPKKRPQTGDITNMFRWNGVLMLSSGMLLLFFRIRQKSKIYYRRSSGGSSKSSTKGRSRIC